MPLSKQQWTEQAVIQSIGNELWCNCPFFGLLKLGLYDKKRFLWGLPSGNGYGDSRGRSDGSVLSVDPLRGLELLAVVLPISNHCCLLDLMDTPFSNPPFPGAAFLTGPFPTPKGVVIEVCKGRGEREGQREGGESPGGREREREGKRGRGREAQENKSPCWRVYLHYQFSITGELVTDLERGLKSPGPSYALGLLWSGACHHLNHSSGEGSVRRGQGRDGPVSGRTTRCLTLESGAPRERLALAAAGFSVGCRPAPQ